MQREPNQGHFLMKKKRAKRFNPMRQKLVRAMASGKNLTEASKIAGYAHPQSATTALRTMRKTMPEIMDSHGLTDDALVSKYLAPLLSAKKTLYFQNGGVVMDKREVADLGIR